MKPKNWKRFQHYARRNPPWIKLHRDLLDNFEFQCLPVASRALAPCIWLLASEHEEGEISGTIETMAFRLRMSAKDLREALTPLIEKGFFIDASNMLAERKQSATPETEGETEGEESKRCSLSLAADQSSIPSSPATLRKQARSESVSLGRGHRLPDDWRPSETDMAFAATLLTTEQFLVEVDKFKDYWRASSGRTAVKRDWSAAWRNWCRKSVEMNGSHGGQNGRGRSVLEAGRRIDANLDALGATENYVPGTSGPRPLEMDQSMRSTNIRVLSKG